MQTPFKSSSKFGQIKWEHTQKFLMLTHVNNYYESQDFYWNRRELKSTPLRSQITKDDQTELANRLISRSLPNATRYFLGELSLSGIEITVSRFDMTKQVLFVGIVFTILVKPLFLPPLEGDKSTTRQEIFLNGLKSGPSSSPLWLALNNFNGIVQRGINTMWNSCWLIYFTCFFLVMKNGDFYHEKFKHESLSKVIKNTNQNEYRGIKKQKRQLFSAKAISSY